MRFIIIGLGAVGGTVAGFLHRSGASVVGVARGPHLEAIRHHGLTVATPAETFVARLEVVDSLSRLKPHPDDVIMLAMKTQDTQVALAEITAMGFSDAAVVCLQNGVENERMALRRLARVYGVCVVLPETYMTPGVVEAYGSPRPGMLDIGAWPSGTDTIAQAIANALSIAGFSSHAVTDINRLKYGKLLLNLGNALEVCCGPGPHWAELYARVRAEAEAVLKSAGIPFADADDDKRRRGEFGVKPIGSNARSGGSSWQSVVRGTGSVETDYLNGEIVMLARLNQTTAPLNAALAELANAVARGEHTPGSLTVDTIIARASEPTVPRQT